MSGSHFFGYGSLVNARTHSYTPTLPALARGWRRVWVATPLRDAAFLSVEPCETTSIQGLIAPVPGGDWAALDKRETAYDRLPVETELETNAAQIGNVSIYRVPDRNLKAGSSPILLSYLDVVIQGFSQVFDLDGVSRFFDSTTGWDRPILDDRTNPIYPRAQKLSPEETQLVDDHLKRLDCTFL